MFQAFLRRRERFLTPLTLLDEENRRQARLLGIILAVSIGSTILVSLSVFISPNKLAIVASASALLVCEIWTLSILRAGRVHQAAITLIAGLWLILAVLALYSGGVVSITYVALWVVVVTSGMLLGGRSAFLIAALNTLVGLGLVVAQNNDLLPEPLLPSNIVIFWLSISAVSFASANLVYLVTQNLKEALEKARINAEEAEKNALQLEEMSASLEEQVAQRTNELKQRTDYLQAAIEVSQATASILDIDTLLQSSVEVILEQFDLYYIGIFLVEPGSEWAVLRAGTGEAGRAMIARGHRLHVGSGMIGWSIANAQARVAADVGADAVRLATAELPETRSEAAIPMRSRGKIIGAISVQSRRPQVFGDMEISVFQVMADQLAIALDNARLIQESRLALQEVQNAYGRVSQRAWSEFIHASGDTALSYRYAPGQEGRSNLNIQRLEAPGVEKPEWRLAMQTGKPVQYATSQTATLLLPIPIRNQPAGVISFTKDIPVEEGNDRQISGDGRGGGFPVSRWTPDEIALLQNIVEQLGFALDSARLYQDTQRLAYRERLTGEVTSRIRQTLDIQTVLTTAVQEIMHTLQLPEVEISLTSPEEL